MKAAFDLKHLTGGESEEKELKEAIIRSHIMTKGRADTPKTSYGGTVNLCNSADSPGGKPVVVHKLQRAEDDEDLSSDESLSLYPIFSKPTGKRQSSAKGKSERGTMYARFNACLL